MLVLLCLLSLGLLAEQLPIKTYTTSDGLAYNVVKRIFQDSRGFLWLATSGLSRFDGQRFINYGLADGLSYRSINDLLETRAGVYWVATNGGGVCRFNPDAGANALFTTYRVGETAAASRVNLLYEDRAGRIWAGTDGGLFRWDEAAGAFQQLGLEMAAREDRLIQVWALTEDRAGNLWIGTSSGLVRRSHTGRPMTQHAIQPAAGRDLVWALLVDDADRLWIGHQTAGLRILRWQTEGGRLEEDAALTKLYAASGQPAVEVRALCRSADGHIWIGTNGSGLLEFDGRRFRGFNHAQGLNGKLIMAVTADRAGNLWLGTELGLIRLARSGFVTYGEADGLGHAQVSSVFTDRAGVLHAVSGNWHVNRFDGERFTAVRFNLPVQITAAQWRTRRNVLQDRAGEWWVATNDGLYRFAKVRRIEELAGARPMVYTTRDGLIANDVAYLYEDARGDLWMSTFAPAQETLARWERATGRFHRYGEADGLQSFNAATAFAEDAAGGLWIGFREGGLARLAAGRFTMFTATDGAPASGIQSLMRDQAGRLWIGSLTEGMSRIDEPAAARPRFVKLVTRDPSSNPYVSPMLEADAAGHIYFGTERGLERLEAATGAIKHYTTADGLGSGPIIAAYQDGQGALWFGTGQGLSRFVPPPDELSAAPPIFIGRLRVAGSDHPLFALGERAVEGLTLEAQQNYLEIDFFGFGEALRYQTKLEGSARDWGAPTEQRSVNLRLAPGAYRFLVRAINADGVLSATPATVSFRILRPVWQRWWFLTLAALLLAAPLLGFARYRAARLQALRESEDRFRTLAETASDAIITIDEASKIVFVNPAAEHVFGYTGAELLGADLTILMPEYLRHLHQAGFNRYVTTGHKHISWEAIELPGRHRSGRAIPLEISFGEFTSNNRRLFTGIVRDITERKRAAEALQKAREERLAELERVRRRIATDLHDDIGSSLTQISILSEVLRQRFRPPTGALLSEEQRQVNEPLKLIASASRELVDSMSDIVWAINPQKDRLSDLTRRMLTFASELLTARNIKFDFRAPHDDMRLGASLRREVFLIFKESINNLVKHAACTEVDIEFSIAADRLTLITRDNGAGFDPGRHHDGHGLQSMRERAQALGGTFKINSQLGQGTVVTLEAPLSR